MSYYDPYQEIDSYLEQAHIDIDSVQDEKCADNYEQDINDLLDSYVENNYSEKKDIEIGRDGLDHNKENLNGVVNRLGDNSFEVTIDDDIEIFCDLDDDYDDRRSTDSSQFVNTRGTGTGTQTSPSQSSTNLTCTSDSSLSPCMVSDREAFDERDRSFSDQTIIRNQWQKSSSTSVLKKITKVNRQARSQSDRHLSGE